MKRLIATCALVAAVFLSPVMAGNIPYDRGCNENCPPCPEGETCMKAENEPTEPSLLDAVETVLVSEGIRIITVLF